MPLDPEHGLNYSRSESSWLLWRGCQRWEKVSFFFSGTLRFSPPSALLFLTLHTGRPNLLLAVLSWASGGGIPQGSRYSSSSAGLENERRRQSSEGQTVAYHGRRLLWWLGDERWYRPLCCHAVSSSVLIPWQISLRRSCNGWLCLLLVFSSCFLAVMQLT